MSDNFLESNFGGDAAINLEIETFIQTLITSKSLRFDLTEYICRYPEMAAAGLITKAQYFSQGFDGTFSNDPRILYGFYKNFSSVFSYSLTADGTAIQEFAHQVGDYFHAQARHGVSELVNALTRFLIDNARLGHGLDLNAYALTLRRFSAQDRFFEFFNIYFDVLSSTNDDFEVVWGVCQHFAAEIDTPKGYDIVWRNFAQFIHLLVDRHKARLPDIRLIAEQEQTAPRLKMLYWELLLKICQEGTLSIEELIDWLDQTHTQERALVLLSAQPIVKPQLRQRLLDKLVALQVDTELKIRRLQLYLIMLEDIAAVPPTFKTQLIKEIRAHFNDPEIADLTSSLRLLGGYTAELETRYTILEEVLQGEHFKPEYLANGMEVFFIASKDIEKFFRFIRITCLQILSVKDIQRALEGAIHSYKSDTPQDFEREAIKLCIDSEGVCRWLGQELLFNEFALEMPASLKYDVLELDLLQQYKLVVSLLNQLRPINHTIPIVIRLLDSPSEIVRELIACKLEELIPAYRHQVIEQVENSLADTHSQKALLLTRLEKVWAELTEILDKKRAIKELDPLLTETEQIRAYNRAKAAINRKIEKKTRKEHRGISSKFKHIQVARGAGTVMPDGTVTPMIKHSVSFTVPRTMFITPERNDYEMRLAFSINWDKEFEEWQQIILSSGSI